MPLETPIAFCLFNRPELTRQVFQSIALAKPKMLYLISDGARPGRPEEHRLVEQSRAVIERVDWDCEVKTNFADVNLGCKQRMASGLSWAFQQSEELIILEDDCLPHPSFFEYCEQLLERYRNDQRIMMISGDNFQPIRRSSNSYYFSRWPHIWGWASWRRAWNHFDVEITSWPDVKSSQRMMSVFGSEQEYKHWSHILDQQHAGEIDTWDFQWAYACWINSGLTILPEANLITNIGFGPDATHTIDPGSRLANLGTHEVGRLIHPPRVLQNYIADQYTWENVLAPPLAELCKPGLRDKWYHRFIPNKAA